MRFVEWLKKFGLMIAFMADGSDAGGGGSDASVPGDPTPSDTDAGGSSESGLIDDLKGILGRNEDEPQTSDGEGDDNNDISDAGDDGDSDRGDDKGKPAKSSEGEPRADTFDASLLERAKALGFSRVEAKSFGTPEALENALDILERRAALLGVGRDQNVAPAKKDTPAGPQTDPGWKCTLKAEDYDEGLVKELNGLGGYVQQRMDAIRAQFDASLGQVVQFLQQKEAVERRSWFDAQLDALGDEYKEHVGKGRPQDRNSVAFKNRSDLWTEVQDRMERAAQSGKQLDRDVALQYALRTVLGDVAKQIARKEIASKIDKRASQTTSRASFKKGGAGDGLSPDEQSVRAVAEILGDPKYVD